MERHHRRDSFARGLRAYASATPDSAVATGPPGFVALVLVATTVLWSHRRWPGVVPSAIFWPLPGRSLAVRWLLLGRSAPRELLAAWRDAVATVPPRVLAARLHALARDATESLKRTAVPIPFRRHPGDDARAAGDVQDPLTGRIAATSISSVATGAPMAGTK